MTTIHPSFQKRLRETVFQRVRRLFNKNKPKIKAAIKAQVPGALHGLKKDGILDGYIIGDEKIVLHPSKDASDKIAAKYKSKPKRENDE